MSRGLASSTSCSVIPMLNIHHHKEYGVLAKFAFSLCLDRPSRVLR
jgi:hypothetical protein